MFEHVNVKKPADNCICMSLFHILTNVITEAMKTISTDWAGLAAMVHHFPLMICCHSLWWRDRVCVHQFSQFLLSFVFWHTENRFKANMMNKRCCRAPWTAFRLLLYKSIQCTCWKKKAITCLRYFTLQHAFLALPPTCYMLFKTNLWRYFLSKKKEKEKKETYLAQTCKAH